MAFPTLVNNNSSTNFEWSTLNANGLAFAAKNGGYYTVLVDATNFCEAGSPILLRAYKSTDGNNWSELDAAGAPSMAVENGSPEPSVYNYFGSCTDGNKIYCIFWDTDFTISMKPFDMGTGLWGATVKSTLTYLTTFAGASNQSGFSCAWRSTDNSVWFIFPAGEIGDNTGQRVFGAKVLLDSGIFDGSLTQISVSDIGDQHFYQNAGMVADSHGNLHIIIVGYASQTSNPFVNVIYHQFIANNSDAPSSIPGDVVITNSNPSLNLKYPNCGPVYMSPDDRIMFPFYVLGSPSGSVSIARAAAAEIPTWEIMTPTDPHFQSRTDFADIFPMAMITAYGKDYIFFAYVENATNHYATLNSSGIGVNWSASTDFATQPSTGIGSTAFISVLAVGGNQFLPLITAFVSGVTCENGTASGLVAFGPVTTTTPTPGTRGARRGTINLDAPTLCLAREFSFLNRIDPHALSCNRKRLCMPHAWDSPLEDYGQAQQFDFPPFPSEARRFLNSNTIVLPAPGDTTVFSFRVPYGYDGFILGNYQNYIGPNFAEGSGDILWRLKINLHYAKDWGSVPVSLGTPQTLSPVEGGLHILSGDLITYQVNAVNASGFLTPGIGRILCGLYGYFYPRA